MSFFAVLTRDNITTILDCMDRIPEERVGTILKRAAELDHETVSLDTLRNAALEAGISSEAVDRAIHEYAARIDAPKPAPKPKRWKAWFRRGTDALKLGILASVIGAVSTGFEALIPITAIAWIYYVIKLARSSKDKAAMPFVVA